MYGQDVMMVNVFDKFLLFLQFGMYLEIILAFKPFPSLQK